MARLFLAIMLLSIAGCGSLLDGAQRVQMQPAEPSAGDSDGTLIFATALPPPVQSNALANIAENDLLDIDVFQVDELDRQVRVNELGAISMPLVGQVQAAGQNVIELESRLEALYGRSYLRAPQITVAVTESAARQVTLDGEFVRPGLYSANRQLTLLRATAQAGGLTGIADQSRLYVFRKVANKRHVAAFSLAAIRAGRQPDPPLFGGDVVVSFASGTRIAMRNLREALGIAVSATSVARPI